MKCSGWKSWRAPWRRPGPAAATGPAAGSGPTAPGIGLLAGSGLTPDQRLAAEAMLSPASLTLVKGYAGTGKTFTLGEVARVWQARGFEVLGGAASGKATQELGGLQGMRTASLAAWDARWSRGERPERGRFVFIMDEAGMVGAGQWARIAGVVKAMGGKLIAVGDPEQLQPVSDLPGWAAVERGVSQATRGAPVAALSSVRRQRSMADRMATEALARGGAEIAPAIRHYIDKGALRLECGVLNDPVGALAAAYYKTGPGKAARRGGLRAACAGLYQPRGLGAERRNPGAGAGARRDRSGRYSRLRHDHADRQNDPDPRADCGAAGARTGRPGDADAPAPRP